MTELLAKTRLSAAGFVAVAYAALFVLPAQAEVAIQDVKTTTPPIAARHSALHERATLWESCWDQYGIHVPPSPR